MVSALISKWYFFYVHPHPHVHTPFINCIMYGNWKGTFLVKVAPKSGGEISVHQAKSLVTSGF